MEKRVLVVDDELDIVAGVQMLLDVEDIESAAAYDCDGAVAMLADRYYPVILTDLRLHSEEEGLRLIDAIGERAPRSRVVVLTGYATPQKEEELLARGVAMVFRKPTPAAAIMEAVQALFEELEREAGDGEVDVEQLYLTMHRKLAEIPRKRFGLPPQVAEDVVQEAWLLFLRKRGLIRQASAWMAGTVANLSRQQIDRKVRHRETADDEALLAMADWRAADIDQSLIVRDALERTDERGRMLCSLIALDGLSYEEVSAATGIPIGSIGPLYIRAKKKMRALLEH